MPIDCTIGEVVDTSEVIGAINANEQGLIDHENDVANPHSVTQTQVGLSEVDNTSDQTKSEAGNPVGDAIIAVDGKANTHIADVNNPHAVTKSQVGLGNADNTSDANKPVSGPQQTALDLKINYTDTADTLVDTSITNPLSANQGKVLSETKTEWKRVWIAGSYDAQDMVRDGSYTMIANQTTEERPSPQNIGLPYYLYAGTLATTAVSAKEIIFGNRYNPAVAVQADGFRVDVVAGNEYHVYIVNDPLGTPVLEHLNDFVADVTGWVNVAITPHLFAPGTVFDMIVEVNEPDGTPTVNTFNYSYTRPNNPGIPASGVMEHSTTSSEILKIHKTDNDGTDRTAFIATLTIGDIIELDTIRWAIQSIIDNGAYVTYQISPAVHYGSTGIYAVNFETVTATPITVGYEVDYNIATTTSGLYIADGKWSDIVPDDNQYGIDMLIQEVSISDHWDVVAISSSGGSGGGGTGLEVQSDVTEVAGSSRIANFIVVTQAQYDAITPVATTQYVIVG